MARDLAGAVAGEAIAAAARQHAQAHPSQTPAFPRSAFWASLTPAELEVVRLVSEGLRNDAIARRLFIAPGTVKVHLASDPAGHQLAVAEVGAADVSDQPRVVRGDVVDHPVMEASSQRGVHVGDGQGEALGSRGRWTRSTGHTGPRARPRTAGRRSWPG